MISDNKKIASIWTLSLLTNSLLFSAPKESKDANTQALSFYSEVDYLLWYANEDGLSYTTTAQSTLPISDTVSLSEKDHFFQPGWQSGVRGLWRIDLPNWDCGVSYTYYYANASDHVSADSDSIPSSNSDSTAGTIILDGPSYDLFQEFPGVITAEVDASWRLRFQRADLELGRKLPFGNTFTLRPFCGVQAIRIDQKLEANTDTFFQSLASGSPVKDTIDTYNTNRLMAIGGRMGLGGSCLLGCGFNLYGNFSGSVLWGQFKIKQTYNQKDAYPNEQRTSIAKEFIEHSHNASIFNFDAAAGIKWNHSFCHKYELGITLGWEEHFYTNINRFQNFCVYQINSANTIYSFNHNEQKGNLSLSGLVLGLSLLY